MSDRGTDCRFAEGADRALQRPESFGVHVLRRESGPPIRLTGRQISKHVGRFGHFVSLWEMRSPGLILAFSGPFHNGLSQDVQKVSDRSDAVQFLEGYCADLQADHFDVSHKATRDPWGVALKTLLQQAKFDDFRMVAGHAIADWLAMTKHDSPA